MSGNAYTLDLQALEVDLFDRGGHPDGEPDASAEWIAESPSTCQNGKCKPGPLADFGSVTFTDASVSTPSTIADVGPPPSRSR